MPKDRWQELCQSVALDDGLCVRDSGVWTVEKLYFWHKYIEMATTSMVGKPIWPNGVCYVDLLAGPGICVDESTGKRFPGSTLIAANAAKDFTRIIACELDSTKSTALEQRLLKAKNARACTVLNGDCNELVEQVGSLLPPQGCLTLVFVDNEGLNVPMSTLKKLVSHRLDLLVLFPDAMDISRNVSSYFRTPNSKLDRFLGDGCDWRSGWQELGEQSGAKGRQFFSELYARQLKKCFGFRHVEHKPIWHKGPLYRLIYATNADLGAKFWRESGRNNMDGQSNLFT